MPSTADLLAKVAQEAGLWRALAIIVAAKDKAEAEAEIRKLLGE